ncbi:MAG: ATP-binding protein [Bacteroidetes bacterium]|nr:ATP-binding protein [Bacteroidota bacterium]
MTSPGLNQKPSKNSTPEDHLMLNNAIRLNSTTTNLQVIREFVADNARTAGFGDDVVYKIELAVDEACTNVIKHSYKNDPSKELSVSISWDGKKLTVEITDSGLPFDPAAYHQPDLGAFIKQRKRGGLGLHLIRSLMDEVRYGRNNEKNQIVLIKELKNQ